MSDNARAIFVKNLAAIMDRRGVTQADLIRELGVSSATASDWCNGRLYPRVDNMQKIANFLGVGLSALTSNDGLKAVADMDRVNELLASEKLKELLDSVHGLSDEDLAFVIQFAKRLKG